MIPALIIAGVALFGGGVGVGVAVSRDRSARAIEAQADLLREVQAGQAEIAATVGAPVAIDAEVRAALAAIPPACVESLGGDPLSPQCMLLACWSYGQSAAQRPDCDAVEALAVETR